MAKLFCIVKIFNFFPKILEIRRFFREKIYLFSGIWNISKCRTHFPHFYEKFAEMKIPNGKILETPVIKNNKVLFSANSVVDKTLGNFKDVLYISPDFNQKKKLSCCYFQKHFSRGITKFPFVFDNLNDATRGTKQICNRKMYRKGREILRLNNSSLTDSFALGEMNWTENRLWWIIYDTSLHWSDVDVFEWLRALNDSIGKKVRLILTNKSKFCLQLSKIDFFNQSNCLI